MNRFLIMDTSLLCCWLKVPSKDTCGGDGDLWDYNRIDSLITSETKKGAMIVLPFATIIETGNHISQAPKNRYDCAKKLAEILVKSADSETPWVAFIDQGELWSNSSLKELAAEWPTLADQELSIGDTTIKTVADFYSNMGKVTILTADRKLKSYEPLHTVPIPRRRK